MSGFAAQEPCSLCAALTAETVHRKGGFIFLCKACQRVAAKPCIEALAQAEARIEKALGWVATLEKDNREPLKNETLAIGLAAIRAALRGGA